MTQGTLSKVTGTVISLEGTKAGVSKGRSWKQYRFTVKQESGEVAKCVTFGTFDKDLIGKAVEFDAEFNSKFSSYSVKGDIAVVGEGQHESEIPTGTETPAPKKRGRKPKVQEQTEPVVQKRTVESDLDSVRDAAEAVITQDVAFAHRALSPYVDKTGGKSVQPSAIATLVQGLQAVRATLFIESNKRERVSAMRG